METDKIDISRALNLTSFKLKAVAEIFCVGQREDHIPEEAESGIYYILNEAAETLKEIEKQYFRELKQKATN